MNSPAQFTLAFLPTLFTLYEVLKTLLQTTLPPNDKTVEEHVVASIRSLLENASKPAVIVDGGERTTPFRV